MKAKTINGQTTGEIGDALEKSMVDGLCQRSQLCSYLLSKTEGLSAKY
jgi:hypothetical protein